MYLYSNGLSEPNPDSKFRLYPKPEASPQEKQDEQKKIKALLRNYCERKNLPYEKLTREQAMKVLRRPCKISKVAQIESLLRRVWCSMQTLRGLMKTIRQEVLDEEQEAAAKARLQTR